MIITSVSERIGGSSMDLVVSDTSSSAVSVLPTLDLRDLVDRWTRYLDVSPISVRAYTTHVRLFLFWLAKNGINQPTREDIIAFRDSLKAAHRPSTIHGYMVAIRLFFQFLEVSGVYRNVALHIKSPKLEKGFRRDYLTSDQSKSLLATCDEPKNVELALRDRAILSVMLTTGLRTVSIINADYGDIGTVGDCSALRYLGKGHNEKNVFAKLTAPVEHAIRKYLAVRGEVRENDPLFASVSNRHKGGRLTTRSLRRIIKNRLKNIGIDTRRVSAHSLRHTAATLNLLAGGTLEETQQLLDHKALTTTQIYAHHLSRVKNQSEQRVSDLIFG